MNYYNDSDPFACDWLRALIDAKLIPGGHVDDRSILDVEPRDLEGYNQCHFFAGIGGWPLALQLAGVPDDVQIWTGSCPCQSVSGAGKRQGEKDERHLWPEFHRLIRDCSPPIVLGEQVESGDGPEWLAGIRLDLDDLGYAVGAACLPAGGYGAPHRRYRLFWGASVGNANCKREAAGRIACEGGTDTDRGSRDACAVADAEHRRTRERIKGEQESKGSSWWRNRLTDGGEPIEVLKFRDGKTRRAVPDSYLLDAGLPAELASPLTGKWPGRVGLLRGLGNAIVPQVAAVFIEAFMDCTES